MCGCFYSGHLPVGVYLPNYGAIVGRMMRRMGLRMVRKRLLTPQQLVASLSDRRVFEDSRSASVYHHEHHPDHHPHSSVPEQRVTNTPETTPRPPTHIPQPTRHHNQGRRRDLTTPTGAREEEEVEDEVEESTKK